MQQVMKVETAKTEHGMDGLGRPARADEISVWTEHTLLWNRPLSRSLYKNAANHWQQGLSQVE